MKRVRTKNNCRYALVYDKEKVLEILDRDTITTAQIAKKMGCDTSTAYAKLRELLDEGRVRQVKAGGIWLWYKVGTL